MAVRRPFVAGNWKMNGNRASAAELVAGVLRGIESVANVEVALLPPFILIPIVADLLKQAGGRIAHGGQNLEVHASGAYTGEIAGAMLRDFSCTYVAVGHSERRSLFGETDAVVAEKFVAAQTAKLVPILCVGETLAERDAGQTEAVVQRQLDAVVQRSGVASLAGATLAYEPVWAIGTGRTATPEQAQAVHGFLRARIAAQDAKVAAGLRILYGGSVKAANAVALFAQPDIDGALVGGASLEVRSFADIVKNSI